MLTTRTLVSSFLLYSAVSMTAGCLASTEDSIEFRDGQAEFWEQRLNYAGNGDVEVHEGGSTDVPDCLIWDIDGASIAQREQPGVFTDLLEIDENEIFAVDPVNGGPGELLCTAYEEDTGQVFKLADDTDGSVLFTLWAQHVFLGDQAIPPNGPMNDTNRAALLYTFTSDQIVAGDPSDPVVLATLTENLPAANAMRKLVLAALLSGECGSAGLP